MQSGLVTDYPPPSSEISSKKMMLKDKKKKKSKFTPLHKGKSAVF
jgi:hypothetical protein